MFFSDGSMVGIATSATSEGSLTAGGAFIAKTNRDSPGFGTVINPSTDAHRMARNTIIVGLVLIIVAFLII